MNFLIRSLIRLGILKNDIDYHLLRALMVIICLFFGYQKWFDYEAASTTASDSIAALRKHASPIGIMEGG
jgi:hypothetical protein